MSDPDEVKGEVVPPPDAPRVGFPTDDDDTGAGGLAGDSGTAKFLSRLLTIHPFLDLYDRSPGSRKWLAFCRFSDYVVRAFVLLLLLVIIAGVAWRALAPLPELLTR